MGRLRGTCVGLFDEENKPAGSPAVPNATLPKVNEPVVAVPAVSKGFSATAPQILQAPEPMTHLFDVLLDFIRRQFPASFVESTTKMFLAVGRFGFLAAMLLSVAFALLLSLKDSSKASNAIEDGVIYFFAFAVLQYVGSRFCAYGEKRNRSTHENLASNVFLECLALLLMLAGIGILILSVFVGIHGMYWAILGGVAAFVIMMFAAFIALNPSLVQVNLVAESRPSEEALGILAFLAKAWLRLAPVVFGVGATFGCLLLMYACLQIFTSDGPSLADENWKLAKACLRWVGIIPIIAYLHYLAIYLVIDLARALLFAIRQTRKDRAAGRKVKKLRDRHSPITPSPAFCSPKTQISRHLGCFSTDIALVRHPENG